jgi:hypothetical protein
LETGAWSGSKGFDTLKISNPSICSERLSATMSVSSFVKVQTYGFSLDGTDGFNDVSGNGQNFTGVNMDASNLDTGDLPPYTT